MLKQTQIFKKETQSKPKVNPKSKTRGLVGVYSGITLGLIGTVIDKSDL